AMQSDGMIVCDQDQEELGKNIFTDEMYNDFQDLRDLAKRITTEPAGEGEYSFWATGTYEEAKKAATWDTLALHGREWRVILVKRV
ncbi:MAG TPA: sodium:calcium antiporter, partial [Candidatus Cloacimonadota bacterium]|nr:sodium:calcium antiporter [Candidatus Cloacimonadota bacterium]